MSRSRNARGLHLFSLDVLVYFSLFFHHFLSPCSLEIENKKKLIWLYGKVTDSSGVVTVMVDGRDVPFDGGDAWTKPFDTP